jgi:hypothetical protein
MLERIAGVFTQSGSEAAATSPGLEFAAIVIAAVLARDFRMGKTYDAVVVGAGVFGAWIAWHLLRAGQKNPLVDKYGPANARARSGGEARVIRMACGARLYDWTHARGRAGRTTLQHRNQAGRAEARDPLKRNNPRSRLVSPATLPKSGLPKSGPYRSGPGAIRAC